MQIRCCEDLAALEKEYEEAAGDRRSVASSGLGFRVWGLGFGV